MTMQKKTKLQAIEDRQAHLQMGLYTMMQVVENMTIAVNALAEHIGLTDEVAAQIAEHQNNKLKAQQMENGK